jgi:hypothetical protein
MTTITAGDFLNASAQFLGALLGALVSMAIWWQSQRSGRSKILSEQEDQSARLNGLIEADRINIYNDLDFCRISALAKIAEIKRITKVESDESERDESIGMLLESMAIFCREAEVVLPSSFALTGAHIAHVRRESLIELANVAADVRRLNARFRTLAAIPPTTFSIDVLSETLNDVVERIDALLPRSYDAQMRVTPKVLANVAHGVPRPARNRPEMRRP